MIKYESVHKKLLADPQVVKEYEEHKAEFEIARSLIKARIAARISQTDVAQKMHTSQSQVARLESGMHFPSLQTLHRYAHAVNRKISFEVKP
ncbi:MAG: transcriptional regulator [uncultured bacterium]|nr:MAG: transcriptional regulator [uncultured bacterium]OFW69721.1 MAG: transcriptional regulator [Alphaproteobacteria bacterium GWC2_42_16]OFW74304.1 MAG: transcriptional regulator [Alphaproteobacteria bacterium GWA2_41_27]OFW84530.1 MAG: transcriptional regulator [Alphaproteobacteria bacterium RIFCSPHIGHO2_12_FULL_42_100]OFW85508.1 MAG: transcriptional regulator [Alphaproteobacteria bacterium RBG_16_42_14]OFW91360.1 MAG: transcriptional regulator [Alphaproteobacteria bacterium RIFCSPHIGHO2_1